MGQSTQRTEEDIARELAEWEAYWRAIGWGSWVWHTKTLKAYYSLSVQCYELKILWHMVPLLRPSLISFRIGGCYLALMDPDICDKQVRTYEYHTKISLRSLLFSLSAHMRWCWWPLRCLLVISGLVHRLTLFTTSIERCSRAQFILTVYHREERSLFICT